MGRLIEHRPCANSVLRAVEIERNERDSLWPWEDQGREDPREIAGLGNPHGEVGIQMWKGAKLSLTAPPPWPSTAKCHVLVAGTLSHSLLCL